MKTVKRNVLNSFSPATVVTAILAMFFVVVAPARAQGTDNRAPEVGANTVLLAPPGNKVSFHVYAVGVQIYTNNPARLVWGFKAPEAVLFADEGGNGEIGIHYAGPTWESESGSKVVGARVAGATVDANAIPWLLLSAVPDKTVGPGIFAHTTYIQRVNTTEGLAPASAPAEPGQELRVPYTAEYYFYRAAGTDHDQQTE